MCRRKSLGLDSVLVREESPDFQNERAACAQNLASPQTVKSHIILIFYCLPLTSELQVIQYILLIHSITGGCVRQQPEDTPCCGGM